MQQSARYCSVIEMVLRTNLHHFGPQSHCFFFAKANHPPLFTLRPQALSPTDVHAQPAKIHALQSLIQHYLLPLHDECFEKSTFRFDALRVESCVQRTGYAGFHRHANGEMDI